MDEHAKKMLELEIFKLNENIKVYKTMGGDITDNLKKLALCRAELYEMLLGDYHSDVVNLASKFNTLKR